MVGAYTIVVREINATDCFIETVCEQFHIDKIDAYKVLEVFKKYKLIKIDKNIGQFKLTDGRVWDNDVITNAITEYNLKFKK